MLFKSSSGVNTLCLGIMVAALVSGCGKDSDEAQGGAVEGKLGSSAYVVVDADDLERSETQLKGTGAIAFKDPTGEIASKKHYS